MSDSITFLSKHESGIRIDNVIIKLIIDREHTKEENIVRMTMHSHSYAEIFTCNMGELTIATPHESVTLLPGDAAIIPPGVAHNTSVDPVTLNTLYNAVGIVCTECAGDGQRDVYSNVAAHTEGYNIHIFRDKTDFCKVLDTLFSGIDEKNEFISVLGFVNELCRLFRDSDKRRIKSEARSDTSAKNIDRLVKLDYLINTKFMTNLNNKQIAADMFISERQLARLVRDHYGSTLHTLIINKRIETAAMMLEKTSYPVESIALLVGFKSKTAFYSDFYKIYGVTPIEYRLSK